MNIDLTPLRKATRPYQLCERCVLDTVGDDNISFDERGICNYCREYDRVVVPARIPPGKKKAQFDYAIQEIKYSGMGRKYDCIMGLSGGMDSSYIAYLAMVNGLRPLVVHLDNGWDAELSVKNIEHIIKRTGFAYYNYVIDWEEFKDLQLAYLKAGVIDAEVPSDQAIFAILHITAKKLRIPAILTGDNPNTERMMPRGWSFRKNDRANIVAIHKAYGSRALKSYPLMGLYDRRYWTTRYAVHHVHLLHYVDYHVHTVRTILEQTFNWRDYRWKHCESIFTQFYQGYILPKRYSADKRKAHLSDLVLSGQITRDEALSKLNQPYYTEEGLKRDYDYVLRKFGLTEEEFESILARPNVPHESFPSDILRWHHHLRLWIWRFYARIFPRIKRISRHMLGGPVWKAVKGFWLRYRDSEERLMK